MWACTCTQTPLEWGLGLSGVASAFLTSPVGPVIAYAPTSSLLASSDSVLMKQGGRSVVVESPGSAGRVMGSAGWLMSLSCSGSWTGGCNARPGVLSGAQLFPDRGVVKG